MRLQNKKATVRKPVSAGFNVHWSRVCVRVCRSHHHTPVHLITSHYVFFLQGLDGVQFSSFLKFCQQYLYRNTRKQLNEETHKKLLRPITVSSRKSLPSRSALGPGLRCTCNHPSASLENGDNNQKTEVRTGFYSSTVDIRSACVQVCTLEQVQADRHLLLCCLWMSVDEEVTTVNLLRLWL